ncbi:MAG: hypothetical protein EOP04_04325 [Proteobacteria bacterium]|nr:MAG: hypothetical protein EOP04_04325 [Pseudomonadota bacterium]
MAVEIRRHPLLQKFFDAQQGEPMAGDHRIGLIAIIKQSNTPDAFTVNVLRIARDNKINSQAVFEVFSWMLEAGFIAPVGLRHYTLTKEFRVLAGH